MDVVSPLSIPPARRSRRGAIPIIEATAADIVEIENKAKRQRSKLAKLKPLIPFMAWCAWLFLGAMWYALHDGFTWTLAYYTSVDVGLSVTWDPVEDTPPRFYSSNSKLFSMVHLTIGVIFSGCIVFYLAQEMIKKKGDWMLQAMHRSNLQDEERSPYDKLKAFFFLYRSRFRIFFICLVIYVAAVIWFSRTIDGMSVRTAFDYVISSMTGAGYASLPTVGTVWWQYLIAASLAGVGGPVLTISIGKICYAMLCCAMLCCAVM
jgi:hypothetical protein